MASFRYKAFLSYSHRDERWGRWLHRALESYRVPSRLVGQPSPFGRIPRRLTPIFRDREEMPTASDLGAVIEQALAASEAMLVICSPAAAVSRWVNEEIRQFRRFGRGQRIFCVIVDGEPHADDPATECFPPALYEPLEGGTAPAGREYVAADARPGGDGRQNAKLKLVAGLLGLGLDDLRQREQQRRHRRLVTIAVGAVAGMVVAVGLATAALLARAEADRQRTRAELEAETARETAEFLVSLFDVADPAEARGNTITAREILDRGATRIDRELVNQPAIRASLLGTMGRVYTGLGLYREATELLAVAQVAGERAELSPEQRVRLSNALAAALYLKGDYDQAAAAAEAALEAARDLPGEPGSELVTALIARADVQAHLGEDAAAEANYREALAIEAGRGQGETAEQARALDGLGISLLYQGRMAEAEAAMTRALEIRERILGEDHPLTIESLNNLAAVAYSSQDLAEAERLIRQAVPRARRVYGSEHPQTSSMLNNFGLFLLERGAVQEAESVLTESVAADRTNKDPTHDDLAFSLNNLALSRASLGRFESAEPLYLEALEIARLHDHRMAGPIEVNLMDLLCETGRPEDALARAEATREALARHYPEDDWRFAYFASVEGGCLVALGENDRGDSLLRAGHRRLAEARGPDWLFTTLAERRLARLEATSSL